jgi:hypothetical protein
MRYRLLHSAVCAFSFLCPEPRGSVTPVCSTVSANFSTDEAHILPLHTFNTETQERTAM